MPFIFAPPPLSGPCSWKHEHSDSIVELSHSDSDTHHRKTTIKINGETHFEHHTDHFEDGTPAHGDAAPRLCSPKCDCVLDANNKCVKDRLEKLGLLKGPPVPDEPTENRYAKSTQEL